MEQHQIESLREAEKRTVVNQTKDTSKKEAYQLSKEQEKELISDLENEIEKIDLELAQNYDEVSARENFFENYKNKKQQLEDLMIEWEETEGQISKFE